METVQTDVAVVGASMAGTTAAALFAREGLSVLLVDRIRDDAAFKKQRTHFIRAGATPVLERLGVVDAMERAGAVRNGLQAWTQAGWVRLAIDGERDTEGRRTHGYTLRRERLDPILRENARCTPGVTTRLGWSVKALVREGERVTGVEIQGEGRTARVRARLVVGADGRHTRVAALAQIPTEVRPHARGGFFAYYRGVRTRTAPALKSGADLDRALRRYARQHRAVLHAEHVRNSAFSATDKLPFLLAAPLAAAHDTRLRELMALSAHRISRRDLRILLRLAFYHLTRPFRRAARGAGAVVFAGPPV